MPSPPDWSVILADLMQRLEARLEIGTPTTEDTVRYYFFLRLVEAGVLPETMILERPHPQLQAKEIDLSVIRPDELWDFEVKYHRPIPSGRNRPFTQLRGQVMCDLYKLALSDSQRRYLLYLADPEMAAHWERHMGALAGSGQASPLHIAREWYEHQAGTLQDTVKWVIGLSPERVAFSVWTRARWAGLRLVAWLLEVSAGTLEESA